VFSLLFVFFLCDSHPIAMATSSLQSLRRPSPWDSPLLGESHSSWGSGYVPPSSSSYSSSSSSTSDSFSSPFSQQPLPWSGVSGGGGGTKRQRDGFQFHGEDTIDDQTALKKAMVGAHARNSLVLGDGGGGGGDDGEDGFDKDSKRPLTGGVNIPGDPTGNVLGDTYKSTRTIFSAGRTNPITGQAEIAERVAINPDEYNERKRNTDPTMVMAPLGSPIDFEIHEGDPMFGIKRRGLVRLSVNGYPDSIGFSHLGGLPKGTELYHIGQCKNRAGQGAEAMSVVTAVVAGTVTYVNNGAETINPGDDIIFSTKLNTVGEGINMKPKVAIMGQPTTKFTPRWAVYHHTNLSVLRQEVEAAQFETEAATSSDEKFDSKKRYTDMVARSDTFFGDWADFDKKSQEQPIHLWSKWHALEMATRFAMLQPSLTAEVASIQEIAKDILRAEKECYTYDNMAVDLLTTRGAMTSDEGIKALRPPSNNIEAQLQLLIHLPRFINARRDHSLVEHAHFMRSRVVGTALTTAVPGKQFDIKLGYFNH
jgi:hypothetical protein